MDKLRSHLDDAIYKAETHHLSWSVYERLHMAAVLDAVVDLSLSKTDKKYMCLIAEKLRDASAWSSITEEEIGLVLDLFVLAYKAESVSSDSIKSAIHSIETAICEIDARKLKIQMDAEKVKKEQDIFISHTRNVRRILKERGFVSNKDYSIIFGYSPREVVAYFSSADSRVDEFNPVLKQICRQTSSFSICPVMVELKKNIPRAILE